MDNDEKRSIVLLINFDAPDFGVLNAILSEDNTILAAQSGDEGLALAVSEKPDLILLNIHVPSVDGFETLKILKSTPETQGIAVIVISDKSDEADEEKSFNLGAVDYFSKPFKNVIVKVRVRTHLQIINHIRKIERTGMEDFMTNIPNRRCFDDRMTMEWRRGIRERTPLSFLMIDVDKFKNYNDTYGHLQGDMLLKAVAKILESWARRPADLAARLGGEEFGLLLPNTPLESALEIAQNFRVAIEGLKIFTVDGKTETRTTISIGVAMVIPNDRMCAEDLIRKADECLYEAKAAGRNRVCFKQI